MPQIKFLISLAFASLASFAASTIHAAAAQIVADSATQSPLSSETPEPAPDPLQQRLGDIYRGYQNVLMRSLSASDSPRDWALAALFLKLDIEPLAEAQGDALLERAAASAPDDGLVQWIAQLQSHRVGARDTSTLTALQRLEPDNAAVWLETLNDAMQRDDAVAADAALARMASSTRSDDHLYDVQAALLKVLERYPLPDEYFAVAAMQQPSMTPLQAKKAQPYIQASAMAGATALPAYQWAIKACRVNPLTGENQLRTSACAASGRLLAAQGKNFVANRVGFAMLRVSGTFTDADIQQARVLDWMVQRFQKSTLPENPGADTADALIAQIQDLCETRSEREAAQRMLARAGDALTPPADWVDVSSPFSAERIRRDQLADTTTVPKS